MGFGKNIMAMFVAAMLAGIERGGFPSFRPQPGFRTAPQAKRYRKPNHRRAEDLAKGIPHGQAGAKMARAILDKRLTKCH
jgi:hypothetical protein